MHCVVNGVYVFYMFITQPVVSCRQQPKATSITREQELLHMAHGHLQFLDLHVGTYFRHF